MAEGIFVCGVHDFSTDSKKSPAVQEDEYYQHQRDVEHTFSINSPCRNCGKKVHYDKVTAKVPQPTSDAKNPKAIIVFCDNSGKCKKEYLANLGVK